MTQLYQTLADVNLAAKMLGENRAWGVHVISGRQFVVGFGSVI